ncbi:MAG: histidine--tRNA ligase [Pseudomonadota bacterium]
MAEKKTKKQPRPKAEPPRGFRDYFGIEVIERAEMLRAITEVYHRYGFDPLESSAVETVEALGKFLPDVDRPNEGVFAWQEGDDETWLALRYDLTAPLARVFAQNRLSLPTPYRRYAVGPVWRDEKPGPGRYRQFYQCDADTVGSANVAADAEICMMLADAFEAVGIGRDDIAIRINNRKVLNGILGRLFEMESADATGSGGSAVRRPGGLEGWSAAVLRTVDKYDKVGTQGVRELLTGGRRDQSGAFIEGVGLTNGEADLILEFLLSKGRTSSATISSLREIVRDTKSGAEGVDELETIAALLDAQGYGSRAVIDPSVVRGLGYYTGPVFEAELTFEITDEDGRRRQFGSVAGGGRYDDLVKRFTGQAVPATGISIGVDRLLAALRAIGRAGDAEASGPVVILALERDRMADYQTMCAELRNAGIRAEVFLGGGNMGKQLKYADKRAAPVAVIQGEGERAEGIVQLKDLVLGAKLSAEIETHEEWAEQPAQRSVPRAGLVEGVRAMLAGGGGTRGPA